MSKRRGRPKVRAFGNDSTLVRETFAQYPSGVAVLAVSINDEKHALVASSLMVGVSLEPCLVALAVQKSSETWGLIKDVQRLGVSIFGKGQGALTRKLSGKDRAARFEQVATEIGEEEAVYIEDAAMWLECSIYDVAEAGDHWMVLLEVTKLGVGDNEPLVWHGAKFRELVDAATVNVS